MGVKGLPAIPIVLVEWARSDRLAAFRSIQHICFAIDAHHSRWHGSVYKVAHMLLHAMSQMGVSSEWPPIVLSTQAATGALVCECIDIGD